MEGGVGREHSGGGGGRVRRRGLGGRGGKKHSKVDQTLFLVRGWVLGLRLQEIYHGHQKDNVLQVCLHTY